MELQSGTRTWASEVRMHRTLALKLLSYTV